MADHAKSDSPAVQAQLDRLAALSPGRDTLGLERIAALCERLGNPQDRLPPVFHVAGTNGKGSTCAFLRSAFEAAGLKAHVYSSPHLVRFNERIRVAGKLIEDEALAALLSEVLDHAEGLQASFFEVTTAAAFLAFSRTPADACIIEVGLGGRLDATNVIKKPAVCGIASLGIDHEGFLLAPEDGTPKDPFVRIGWEKAGIAKAGVPLVIQKYDRPVHDIISAHARTTGSTLIANGVEWNASSYRRELHYRDEFGTISVPLPALPGPHQAQNAALAIAMLRHQQAVKIPESAFEMAMGRAKWPARLQKLSPGPLTSLLPDAEIWLDGGHNADAGAAIGQFFQQYDRPVHLIIGMLANKDPLSLLHWLEGELDSIIAIPVPNHEYHPVTAYRSAMPVEWAENVTKAFDKLAEKSPDTVLICGSLYLAGEVLRLNGQIPD
ncbi:folylpolyglutamate synthase/dihydrofolate synthase family protein [Sphingorhabdus sp.]|uniref:bifunctional folylpolyglutamate synthase/dihydrofolate synthase n=1 Tax=Sphingorhabdus sp. TaxID=1902408 RepID=UPI0032B79F65